VGPFEHALACVFLIRPAAMIVKVPR